MEAAIHNMNLFPSLGPALMISMGYIDLGKWVAAVEAGSRFGSDLILPLLFFNLCAILCQYLATCISTATGKNLAEICQEEYSKSTCILLGVQAELSILTSKLTMVLGVAQSFNLLLGFDLVTCIIVTALASNILPFFVTSLEKPKGRTICTGIAAYALLGYVLGVLFNQPKIPLPANVMFPKLSGESTYSLMALLGANVMAQNFYIHSSLVQSQRSRPVAAIGALFHDHFFTILFIFTGLFLVYFILINSAAVLSSTADVILNFQDVVLLMDQVFPMVPPLFLSILLFSSQIVTLTCNIGAHVVSHHFFGLNLSLFSHHILLNSFTVLPALYFTKSNGAEGIYQVLTICQVVQAILLPSSVIPLFRVASSKVIMKAFKISYYLELCSFVAFLMMLSANVIFLTEMLLGNSGWMNGLKGNVGNSVVIPYPTILLVSCLSVGLALFLAVTPLKSASDEASSHNWLSNQPTSFSERRGVNSTGVKNVHFEEDRYFRGDMNKSSFEYFEPEPEKEAGDGGGDVSATTSTIPVNIQEEPTATVKLVDWTDPVGKVSSSTIEGFNMHKRRKVDDDDAETGEVVKQHPTFQSFVEREVVVEEEVHMEKAGDTKQCLEPNTVVEREMAVEQEALMEKGRDIKQSSTAKSSVEREVVIEQELHTEEDKGQKEIEQGNKSENEILSPHSQEQSLSDEQLSVSSVKVKDFDTGNGSRSLSHLSGLGRSARKQLAAILDEFWGHLFDYHGKLTQDASAKKLDVLLGLDLRIVGSGDKASNNPSNEPIKSNLIRPAGQVANLDLPYGLNAGSPSWPQGMQLPPTSNGLMEQQTGKLYSNFNSLSSYSDNQFYQPATIHGYQLASYLKGLNANRGPYSGALPDPMQRSPSPYVSNGLNLSDSVSDLPYAQNMLGSLSATSTAGLQSPISTRLNQLIAERRYLDSSLLDTSETLEGGAGYAKKYHSSPDISAMIAATRAALLNEAKLTAGTGTIGPHPYLSRMVSDRSQSHLGPISRSGVGSGTISGSPTGFDEFSPQRTQRDLFSLQSNLSSSTKSLQSNLSPSTKSLWSKQPFEQLFGITTKDPQDFTYADAEKKLLKSLRFCITKLLKLEGASWLFSQNGGSDEELIDRVAGSEKLMLEQDNTGLNHGFDQVQHTKDDLDVVTFGRPVPNCGEDCVWRAALVISFGVWCIRRVLDLSLVESRPELWGKYTYVLNRLQGIVDLAFSKPRSPLTTCACLVTTNDPKALTKPPGPKAPLKTNFTTASSVLEVIKDVETAVSSRKGRTGTAAGDVAFPKGKENLASVLKRYKRRLSNKSTS
ncbi:Divalent metal cation transporter MntH 2 [Rhynchospora pubera]|uniref:Divalent metal cation transporter MntH 2 n=1 Tax=Rhynchospora pubera TaxID=906938 RepID=A0AAV8H927_9POAL|nr:Divalent metal cation transporter MntH 2 [Rhynchospora pubera]